MLIIVLQTENWHIHIVITISVTLNCNVTSVPVKKGLWVKTAIYSLQCKCYINP